MPLRLAFMGSDPIALPVLAFLRQHHDVRGVFTQPDRPSGRGMKLVANPIKEWALAEQIPVLQPERCGPEAEDWLRVAQVDAVVVMAYGQILKRSLLDLPPCGVWNLHASLLPKYRGASPIQTAVAEGERETGVSWMRIEPKLDAGPVMDVERVEIGPEDTASQVWNRLAAACPSLAERCLRRIESGDFSTSPQDVAAVSYCRILRKEDAALDFTQPASVLHNRIRAMHPWPGSRVRCGEWVLKVGRAQWHPADLAGGPGAWIHEGSGLRVATGQGTLELLSLQRPGGRMLPIADFLRGTPLPVGERLTSEPMLALTASTPKGHGVPA